MTMIGVIFISLREQGRWLTEKMAEVECPRVSGVICRSGGKKKKFLRLCVPKL